MPFITNRNGAITVEFAIIALPFLALAFCIAESGFDLFVLSNLDSVTQKISRQIQIGNVQQQKMNGSQFNTAICAMLPSVLSCSNVISNVQTVSTTFYNMTTQQGLQNGIQQYALKQLSLNQNNNQYCPGQSGQYVVVQLIYIAPAITGIWATSSVTVNGQSVRVFATTNVFRNEAFSSASPVGC